MNQRTKPDDRNLRGYIDIGHVATAGGVTRDAVATWVRNNMGKRALKVEEGRRRISLRAAELYLNSTRMPKASVKPRGWVTLKSLCEDIGITRTPLADWLVEVNARCLTYRTGIFIHPEDAEYAIRHYRSRQPLPGFISITDLSSELNRDKIFVYRARKKLGINVHMFREPGQRERGYIAPSDANKIRELSKATRRTKKAGGDNHTKAP